MATPFTEDGALDLEAARRLAAAPGGERLARARVAGTTGESPTLSDAEKLRLLEAVKDEVGDQATIVCGTGSNDTRHSVELTAGGLPPGADAVLVVTPYYNKPNRPACAPTSTPSPRPPATPRWSSTTSPRAASSTCPRLPRRAGGRDPRTWPRSSRPTTTSSGRSRASTCWPATTTSSCAAWSWGDRRNPRLLAPGRARDAGDLRGGDRRRRGARPRARRRASADLRGARR